MRRGSRRRLMRRSLRLLGALLLHGVVMSQRAPRRGPEQRMVPGHMSGDAAHRRAGRAARERGAGRGEDSTSQQNNRHP